MCADCRKQHTSPETPFRWCHYCANVEMQVRAECVPSLLYRFEKTDVSLQHRTLDILCVNEQLTQQSHDSTGCADCAYGMANNILFIELPEN